MRDRDPDQGPDHGIDRGPTVAAPSHLVVLAPNWLGDALMALPLLADVRRAWTKTRITIAARPSVAPLFAMVPAADDTLVLGTPAREDERRLRAPGFDAALLLPNAFRAAWLAWRAAIPERWGFDRDWRGRLLTRAIPTPRTYRHQADYYQALAAALGVTTGEALARVAVPGESRVRARKLLEGGGIATDRPFVVFAPGAAYGRAKQWLPQRFAELAQRLAAVGISTALVGAKGDVSACRDVAQMSPAVDLSARTDLPTLAGLMTLADAVVANDSGAMHLAAAVGARVVAIFGPTDEHKTSPLRGSERQAMPVILSAPVWCRPCMLRECPIDHRCMTRIPAGDVMAALFADAGGAHIVLPPTSSRLHTSG